MTAYEKGTKARQLGVTELEHDTYTINPYRAWTDEWFEWAEGWRDEDAKINAKSAENYARTGKLI